MDRDPNSLTDDVATLDSTIHALDPEHYWKLDEASGTSGADTGFGAKAIALSGTPARNTTAFFGPERSTYFDGNNDFGTIAASPRASGTTFTIFAALFLERAGNPYQAIVTDSAGIGLYLHNTSMTLQFLPAGSGGGYDLASAMPLLSFRTPLLVAVRVTDGVAEFGLNGVFYEGGGGTNGVITSFTPERIGAVDGSTSRLVGLMCKVADPPGVALTNEDFGRMWAARFPCLTATTAIANRALSHIGESNAITALATGSRAQEIAVRLHYPTVVDQILTDYDWPFARRFKTLDLIDGAADDAANSDWTYAYRVPDRMMRALRIVNPGMKRLYDPNPPPFHPGQDEVGGLIYTDMADAELEYIQRPTCTALQGGVKFRTALEWLLAAYIAPGITKNGLTRDDCLKFYAFHLQVAMRAAANEGEPQDTNRNDPDWITGR